MLRKLKVKESTFQRNGRNGIYKQIIRYYFVDYQHFKVGNQKEVVRKYIPETRDNLHPQ